MRVDIITCLPKLLDSFFAHSIIARAINKGIAEVHTHDLRDYSANKHRQIDDYAYGHGAGMVLKPEPLATAIENLQSQRDYDEVIYMTPDGDMMNQAMVNELSLAKNMIIICGHYKGIDQRIRDMFVSKEISYRRLCSFWR